MLLPQLAQPAIYPLKPRGCCRSTCRAIVRRAGPSRRRFLTASSPQQIRASRILPYSAAPLYEIVADVSAYSSFLPYCLASTVTAWTKADGDGRKWPTEARLQVGWKGIQENWLSRVQCRTGESVEAYTGAAADSESSSDGLFKHLRTLWTIRQLAPRQHAADTADTADTASGPPPELTELSISVDFAFHNPLYDVMSAAVTPRLGQAVMDAFEGRARALLEGGDARASAGESNSSSG